MKVKTQAELRAPNTLIRIEVRGQLRSVQCFETVHCVPIARCAPFNDWVRRKKFRGQAELRALRSECIVSSFMHLFSDSALFSDCTLSSVQRVETVY